MKLKSIITFLICTILLVANAIGQKAFVQSDRLYYAVGERVSGAARVPVNGDIINNVVIKWELFGSGEEPLYHFFTIIDKSGWTAFDFYLPYNLATGGYGLRGSVSAGYDNLEMFTLNLSVINPSTQWNDSLTFNISEDVITNELAQNWLAINNTSEGENLVINEPGGLKLLTISVCETETNPYANLAISSLPDHIWSTCSSWSRELWFYGKTQKFKKPTSVNIIGIYSNEADSMKMTKSNQDGIFKTFVPPFYGTRHFQAISHGDIENKISYSAYTPTSDKKWNIDGYDSLAHYYYKLSQVRQSVKTYFSVFDPVDKKQDTLQTPSVVKAQKTYKIANYNKFDLLRDFCRENDSPLKFRENNNRWKAEILIPGAYAKKFNALTQNPLIIVNRKLATNDHLISSLKTKEIERVNLFYNLEELRRIYSVFGTEGVVKITSGGRLNCWDDEELEEIYIVQGLLHKEKSRVEVIQEKINKGLKPIFEPCLLFEAHPPLSELRLLRGDEKTAYHIFGLFMDGKGQLYLTKAVLPSK